MGRSARLVILALGSSVLMPGSASAQTDVAAARMVAQMDAQEWSRSEPGLLGVEPPYGCAAREDAMRCRIGYVTLRGPERELGSPPWIMKPGITR